VFILQHYFTSKLSIAVHEAFSNADKEVLNKTTIHRLITTFQGTGSVSNKKNVWRWTVLTGEMLCSTEETLARSPQNSLSRLSQQSGLSQVATTISTSYLPDFFLWVFLKERIYLNNPQSFKELKHNIEQTITNIEPETLHKVTRHTLKRVDGCL
jgi:hypothetical protein